MFEAIALNNADIKLSNETQIKKMDELHIDINKKFNRSNNRVKKMETKVDKTSNDVNYLKRKINEIDQEQLATHMEITGHH